jgi:hypothetical protein
MPQRSEEISKIPTMEELDRRYDIYIPKLKIDRDHIDDMVSEHAELFEHVVRNCAYAGQWRRRSEIALEQAEAEADATARDAAGDSKITETEIKKRIRTDLRVKAATTDLLEAKHLLDLWQGMVESFKQRGGMLRESVPLHLARMFPRTSVTAGGDDLRATVADAIHERAGQERVRRRLGRQQKAAE